TRDMSVFEGMRLMRGQPGTQVQLTVIRNNQADPHSVSLVREKPSATIVSGRMLNADTGYLRIAAFRTGVAETLAREVKDLSKAGATSLIVDLRRTAEGPVENGLAAARLFVKSGTLAQQTGRLKSDAAVKIASKPGDGAIEQPVQILVSTGTSGAAELFSAALRGNKRADLVGEHTLGRAALQKLVKLPENRGLW